MKILLVPSSLSEAQQSARLLAARLTVAGYEACIQPLQDGVEPVVPVDELSLVVPMGGDGTMLKAARLIDFANVPILGFNYGTLGFMSGNPQRDEVELVTDALCGDLHIENRATLDALVTDASGKTVKVTALNEIAYTRGANGHVVEYQYAVNGTKVARLKADGLVVSTATGSTAYSLSAGGPIVSPGYKGLLAVPLAPHSLSARALVMAPSDVLEVSMFGRSVSEASLFVDGNPLTLQGVTGIVASRGEREVRIVTGGINFFENVSKTFYGGGFDD